MARFKFPEDATPKEKKFAKMIVLENMRQLIERDKQKVKDFESAIRVNQEEISEIVMRILENSKEIARIEMIKTD